MRDGPSVLIHRKESATQRVPANLVSRVVIIGNVRLDAGAITLFTENDIPVAFMNHSGEEAAVAIPYNHRLAKHYEEQKVFLKDPENIERYAKWAVTKRMVIQTNVLKRLFKQQAYNFRFGVGEGNYQQMISELKPEGEGKWAVVNSIVMNLFRGLIIGHLIRADLDPHCGVIHRRHNFGLALDFCHITGGESDMQTIQFFRSADVRLFLQNRAHNLAVTDSGMKNIIHRFENRQDALSNMVEIIIDEMFELMRELRT
jgi:CRISPR/Cas system-associated endonuclease Cas1